MPTPLGKKKKVSSEGGGLEGPLLMGPEWPFFGPFAVPHLSPATKRKSSLSLLIEMQEPPRPRSSPQAPMGKARGPEEPSARETGDPRGLSPIRLKGDSTPAVGSPTGLWSLCARGGAGRWK